ncbi:MAG: PQQ-dependent sugar dehydrogenase [Verrucomicrobia bacterium]|nr:PQQ-dependent sugar dehydrogenase [Verrucomicrobiota bacterium]MDA1069446.1 PQQ-dependent sugar dehydrogenase [Verrucomicrobiota bacterium]
MKLIYPKLFTAFVFAIWSMVTLTAQDPGIQVPQGFKATVVADNLGKARAIAIRDNGDMYVSLNEDVDLNYLIALRDTDGDGKMDVVKYFGELGSLVKSIQIYNGYLYAGATTQVVRYKLTAGELLPQSLPEVIITGFPTPRSHRSKNIDFDDQGNLYLSAGAPSNSCQELDRTEGSPGKMPCEELGWGAGIWRFDAETLNQKQLEDGELIATGIRNAVGIDWDPVKKELYAVSNGRDNLIQNWGQFYNERESAEKPAEQFQLIRKGMDFGWPYAYYDQEREAHMINPEYGGDGKTETQEGLYDKPIYAFPGHWAPVGLQFYNADQFPAKYKGGAFIVFHGSWNRAPLPQQGYNVVFVPFEGKYPSGEYEEFATGFKGTEMLMTPASATYRPTGITVAQDGSLYLSEDNTGRIWKVEYTGEMASTTRVINKTTAASPTRGVDSEIALDPNGQKLYTQYCMACHQVDGSGVPNIQPSLIGSAKLSDDTHILKLMLLGSDWIEEREYNNVMTTFSYLSDSDIATILNYSKARFAKTSPTITAKAVANMRASLNP